MNRLKLLAVALTLWVSVGCAPLTVPARGPTPAESPAPARIVSQLAPTGVLRVGVYPGSPTSWVRLQGTGESVGVAYELGLQLAQRLGVPAQIVEYPRVADVVEALTRQQVDMTFTNASAARARLVDFTPALIRLELGLLLPAQRLLTQFDAIDQEGVRVGVSQGSSSQMVLSQRFRQAKVVPVTSLSEARGLLGSGQLDAFATNKGILFEMADRLPGFRVSDDRWGFESLAVAIPKGRGDGLAFVNAWLSHELAEGEVLRIATRAGLRGLARD